MNKDGFSLIEVMVAFSILMVTFISLMGAFPTALSINKGAENMSIASYLAQDKIEELNSDDYEAIATGTIEARHRLSADTDNSLYRFERETAIYFVDQNLQATSSDTGLKIASTTVHYTDTHKNNKSYNLKMLISLK